jgi:glycosyltransferase involved in cell wall biosynthesis
MTRPIRILELRCADGGGGGPEKTILLGAARSDPARFAVTVCYLRSAWDEAIEIDRRAQDLGIDFVAISQRRRLDLPAWRRVRQLVRQRQIDIVHAHDYKTDLMALLLARMERIIPLSTAHGFTGHSRIERCLYYPADRRLLARFPLVIAVSSQLRATLIRAGARPERVRTVLNGIDHRRFRRDPTQVPELRQALGLSPGEIALGVVGRVEPQKRIDILLRSLALLLPSRPNLRLFVVGEGSLRRELQQLARELGVAHACRFLGHRGDLDRIYPALDVLVQSSDYEGTPNVVLEAMAFETPIVATDVGGTAELIHNDVHGSVVPPGDPNALARAIARTLDDKRATSARVAAARALVEQDLSFEARMRTVERVYEELMHAFHAPGTRADVREQPIETCTRLR